MVYAVEVANGWEAYVEDAYQPKVPSKLYYAVDLQLPKMVA